MTSAPIRRSIDWSRYHRPGLVGHLEQMLGLPGALWTLLKTTLYAVLVTWVVLILAFHQAGWALTLGALLYGTLAAALLGVALGIGRMIRRALAGLTGVLTISLEVARRAAADLEGVEQGQVEAPTTIELVRGAMICVILPCVEGVLRGQSRLLGGLLSRLYRGALERALREMERDQAGPPEVEAPIEAPGGGHQQLRRLIERLDGIQAHVEGIARKARRRIVLPLALLFCGFVLLATAPLALAGVLLTTLEPPPSAEGKLLSAQPLVVPEVEGQICAWRHLVATPGVGPDDATRRRNTRHHEALELPADLQLQVSGESTRRQLVAPDPQKPWRDAMRPGSIGAGWERVADGEVVRCGQTITIYGAPRGEDRFETSPGPVSPIDVIFAGLFGTATVVVFCFLGTVFVLIMMFWALMWRITARQWRQEAARLGR